MKRVLTIATFVALMASCAKEYPQDAPVEIKITSGVEAATKAPIPGGALPTSAKVAFVRAQDAATAAWDATAKKVLVKEVTAGGGITFVETQYYNSNPALKSYLIGYFPEAGAYNAGKVTWATALDGKTDLMHTSVVSGDKNTAAPLAFEFKHALVWLVFNIKGSTTSQATWGNVTSIEVTSVNTKAELTCAATPSFSFNTPGTISSFTTLDGVPASTPHPTDFAFYSQTMVPIPAVTATGKYNLLVKTARFPAGQSVEITPENPLAGKKYEVNLTFNVSEITANATVAAWVPGKPVDAPVN